MTTIKTKLYKGEVELIFESFKHTYMFEGKKIPSVTTILSIINKPALINWAANMACEHVASCLEPGKAYDELQIQAIIEGARKAHYQKKMDSAQIGTFMHKWVEDYIKGQPQPMPVNENLRESVKRFLQWVKDHEVKFLLSEQQIYSAKYGYTGTADFICKIDGKMYLGDLKTSSGIYPEYLIQTAAYRHARVEEFPEEKYEGQMIIRIGKEDASFEIAVVRDDNWYKEMFIAFIAALKLYQNLELLKEYRWDTK